MVGVVGSSPIAPTKLHSTAPRVILGFLQQSISQDALHCNTLSTNRLVDLGRNAKKDISRRNPNRTGDQKVP
jgi:hypothetical protein